MNRVSIIIVNYNGKPWLEECIESVKASEAAREEIIVVDNASTDGSRECVQDVPDIKLVKLDSNCGFAQASNLGAAAATGDYLVFLNNDTVVKAGWLDALLRVMTSDANIGVAGSKLLFHDNPTILNSAGANITFNGRGYDIGFLDTDSEDYNVLRRVGAVCAASMMVRQDEFLRLGGFDPLYFMYFEDVDLCWRYWLSGQKVVYVPESVVYHRFSASSESSGHSPLKVFYGTRNSMFNILKNYELPNLLPAFLFNVLYHSAQSVHLLLFGRNPAASWALIRAYGSLFRHMPEVLRKRKDVQSTRKIADGYLLENSLIARFATCVREYRRRRRAALASALQRR